MQQPAGHLDGDPLAGVLRADVDASTGRAPSRDVRGVLGHLDRQDRLALRGAADRDDLGQPAGSGPRWRRARRGCRRARCRTGTRSQPRRRPARACACDAALPSIRLTWSLTPLAASRAAWRSVSGHLDLGGRAVGAVHDVFAGRRPIPRSTSNCSGLTVPTYTSTRSRPPGSCADAAVGMPSATTRASATAPANRLDLIRPPPHVRSVPRR